jgi:hypothetical protein
MPRIAALKKLHRVNISLEGDLHEDAQDLAAKLGFADGLSGYISRLLIEHMKDCSKEITKTPRKYTRKRKS